MKRFFVPTVILLVCAFIVTGCSTSTPTPTPLATASPTSSATVTNSSAPLQSSTTQATATPSASTPTTTTPAATSGAKYGGNLRWIEPNAPSGPIGSVWESPFGNSSQQVVEEPLLNEQADGTDLPWLVSYEVNADPQNPSITFHVKKGVKFQDGTDFNAQALQWNIQKTEDSHMFQAVTYLKSLNVVDDYTLQMPMTQWRNSIVPAFGKTEGFVVSPTAFNKNGLDWMRTHMVGTGPFVQTDYQTSVSMTAVRNPNYWAAGLPYLDGVQYLFVSDLLTQEALFKSGGADVLNLGGNARIASELAGQGYHVITQMADAASLLFDSANSASPWSNLQVRQAAEYAIDKNSIAKAFGFGYWQAATQAPSPQAPAYIPSITGRNYDVAKAKQLLTDAGYPNGFKTKLIAQDTANQDVVVALQSYLSKVGIQADLEFDTASKFVNYQSTGWTNGLLFLQMSFEGNIIPAIGFNFPPGRTARYTVVKDPPNWTQLYNAVGTSPTLQKDLEQNVTQAVYDNLMWLPIYWEPSFWVTNGKVQDSGIGTRAPGGVTFWNSSQTWFSK